MAITVEEFREEILECGILDQEEVHFELASGRHGRKLEFDKIPDGSQAFNDWVEINSQTIYEKYVHENLGGTAIISVANGTNRIVKPIAETIGKGVISLQTMHDTPSTVNLTPEAIETLKSRKIELAIYSEDVATTGATTLSAILHAKSLGVPKAEALITWQRRPHLLELIKGGAVYNSIIVEEMPAYSPEYCRAVGYCAHGWQLIER